MENINDKKVIVLLGILKLFYKVFINLLVTTIQGRDYSFGIFIG